MRQQPPQETPETDAAKLRAYTPGIRLSERLIRTGLRVRHPIEGVGTVIGWVDNSGGVNGFDYHYDLSVKKHQESLAAGQSPNAPLDAIAEEGLRRGRADSAES